MIRMLLFTPLLLVLIIATLWRAPMPQTPGGGAWVTLEQVQQASELVTLRVPYQRLIETQIHGYSGGVRCVVLVSGEALIATDLSQADLAMDAITGAATLTLEQPRLLQSQIDHDQSHVMITARRGLWTILPGKAGEPQVLEQAWRQAQQQIAAAAASDSNVEATCQQAELVLLRMVGDSGDDELIIRWRP